MKTTVVLTALLFAMPLLAQSSQTPSAPPPAAPAPGTPTLEAPPTAAPEPEEPKKDATPEAKPAAAAKTEHKFVEGEGKVVEEIIARVNNEIITRSELEKSKSAAEEDAKQDCSGHCTPEQLQVAIEDRQKTALRDLIDQYL